ncbi:MAG: hypothetical protein ABEK12_03710, partial [Candidatus Nanohaloarchaea archaeon]
GGAHAHAGSPPTGDEFGGGTATVYASDTSSAAYEQAVEAVEAAAEPTASEETFQLDADAREVAGYCALALGQDGVTGEVERNGNGLEHVTMSASERVVKVFPQSGTVVYRTPDSPHGPLPAGAETLDSVVSELVQGSPEAAGDSADYAPAREP